MSSAPSASPTPVLFIFQNVPNMTVCGMGQVSWIYSGDASNTLGFAITNDNIGPLPSGTTSNVWPLAVFDGETEPLSGQGTYSWSPVSLESGMYKIVADVAETSQLFNSPIFSVLPGDDTSCLTASSSGTTHSISSTSSLSTTTASNVGVVQGGLSTGSSDMNGGEVAGIIIGALAAAGLLIAAILLFRRCRSGRSGVGRFGKHERRPSRLFEKKGWLQSGNNGNFGGNVSGGAVAFVRSPTKKDFSDLKDDGERGLHLDDSSYGRGLGQGLGISDYPHRLSYAENARNHADNIGASVSEEDVSLSTPSQMHSQELAHEYSSIFTPANRAVAVPLAIHRPGQTPQNSHRGSVGSVFSESTVVGSPQSTKFGAIPFTRARPGFPHHDVPASPSAENVTIESSQDPFVSPPSTPSPAPSELDARSTSAGHGSALSRARAHMIDATVSGGDGTQLPVSLFHPSSQYIAPSPRSTFPQSVSASDLSVAPSMSSEFEAHSYGRPSGDSTTYSLGLNQESTGNATLQAPPLRNRRTLSARKPVPYSSSEALELSPRVSPTGERNSQLGAIGRSSSDSSTHDWSSAAALSHASVTGGGAGVRTSMSSRSTLSESNYHLVAPPSPYSPATTATTARASAIGLAGPFAGLKGLPELNHKSSFGDKPMHIIMPDPPAPPME